MSASGLVYGLHAVRAVLERRPDDVLRLAIAESRDDPRMRELRQLAAERRVAVNPVRTEELDQACGGGAHQGVMAEVRPREPLDENGLLDLVVAAPAPALVLALDGVTDPHNLGACLRTADAAGAIAVVVPRDRSVGMTPAVRKVAAGAAETTPLARVTNLARALRDLKAAGLWIVGTAADGEQAWGQADLRGPLAIVLGAEGSGMRRLTRETCDFCLRLPMAGAVASLNVSVTAGIVLYESLRQRGQVAKPERVR